MGRPKTRPAVVVSLTIVVAAAVSIAACGSDDDSDDGSDDRRTSRAPLPAAVRCTTQYRPDAETLTGVEEPALVVERVDDVTASPVRHPFANMILEVTFHGDAPDGRVVTIRVTTVGGEEIWQSTHQYTTGDELRTDFGGHGFTGLNYIRNGPSSLQVSCSAV